MQLVDHVGQFFVLYITRSGERFFVLISSCSQENDGGVYMKARCKRLVELFFVAIMYKGVNCEGKVSGALE